VVSTYEGAVVRTHRHAPKRSVCGAQDGALTRHPRERCGGHDRDTAPRTAQVRGRRRAHQAVVGRAKDTSSPEQLRHFTLEQGVGHVPVGKRRAPW
jgi:hypothetical protein